MTELLVQGTEEWRLARAGLATASRFGDIMATVKTGEAAARRNYRTDLVVERLTGKPLEGFTSAAMKQGTEREPFARMAYEARTGSVVREVGLFRFPELMVGASPDGILDDNNAIGIECKCPERSAHLRYLQEGAEPAEYTWQIQGQMWICNLDAVDFVSYNPDFPEHLQLIVRRIPRNEEAIARLAAEVRKFLGEVDAEVERVRNLKVAA
jgi:hypothetical protein